MNRALLSACEIFLVSAARQPRRTDGPRGHAGQLISASNAGGNGTENFSYAGASQDQLLSDGSATGITYGLPTQYGQPWVQSYTPAQSTSPVYILHDQRGTPSATPRTARPTPTSPIRWAP